MEKPTVKGAGETRRDLLKVASLAAAGVNLAEPASAAGATVAGMRFEPRETVRLGVIGIGARGNGLISTFSALPSVRVTAICDTIEKKTEAASAALVQQGKSAPAVYHSSERAFEQLVKRDDVDLVIIATPWIWHVPMAVAAMKAGKHAAVEVPAARTVKECWELVNTSEATRRHCILLENCCYGANEMMVLNMVRAGIFGEITHGACAYNHDLRAVLFSDEGEGLWRRRENELRNGNLYPTHGLGPVAHYMDINHGDKFDYLVSMSSPSLSLQAYRKEELQPDDPRQKETYRKGDLNVSLIRTAKGRVITVEHNVATPQPYDRINLIAGTKGIFRDYPARIFVEGPGKEEFAPLEPYREKFEHQYWKKVGELARELNGHGGMDFVMAYRLIACMREGLAPDIDVYDAASWSVVGPLSEQSVARGSAPVPFPEFTRGGWRTAPRPLV